MDQHHENHGNKRGYNEVVIPPGFSKSRRLQRKGDLESSREISLTAYPTPFSLIHRDQNPNFTWAKLGPVLEDEPCWI